MKKNLRIPLLTALLLLLMIFSSCSGKTGVPEQTEAVFSTEAPETEAPALPPVDYSDGYALIRPDETGDVIVEAFKELREALIERFGVTPTVSGDFILPGKEPAEKEILIGNTNRPESAQVLAECGTGKYTVRVLNGKVVIVGSTDALTAEAVRYFIENVLPAGKTVPADYAYTCTVGFPVSALTLLGEDISRFRIVYKGSTLKNAALVLSDFLEKNVGLTVPAVPASASNVSECEIVFGRCGRDGEDGKTRGYDDYACYVRGKRLYFDAGSARSAEAAIQVFLSENLRREGALDLSFADGYLYDCVMPDRQTYIEDPSRMLLHWAGQWSPSAGMLSYDEKIACLMQTDTEHLFTVSHRGDFLFYPENSIESMISVWAMGGDCVEIDVHYTADGVPVIMHDATLSRMTDYEKYAGKNGYPASASIGEWTLEQLRVLCLKDGQGGTDAAITPYKIPTLEEALVAAKGRFFIILDKQAEWRYVDIPDIQPMSAERYIYPYMRKTGNFSSVLISYGTIDNTAAGTLDANEAVKIQKYVKEHDGADMYMFLRCWTTRSTVEPYAKVLTAESLTNVGLLINGAYSPNKSLLKTVQQYRKQYPRALIGAWTIDTNGYDCAEVWESMYDAGYRSIMTNNMFTLVQYAATKIK